MGISVTYDVTIPYGRQEVTEADVAAVAEVLRSDFLTQGPMVPRFEKAVAERCDARYAVATNSATSALHIACLALGLGPGDWLWTVPNTFVATANCALYCGAHVDFVDIDPRSYNMCTAALGRKLAKAESEGRLPKIVIPIHFSGQSADMHTIRALAEKYGFKIIEDASHAVGARYRNRPVGDCRYSDIAILSFHPVKIITTGEGGMALTNDTLLARRMSRLRTHGITREAEDIDGLSDGPWYYAQVELGMNYRLTDIQAALGISQMERLEGYIARRHLLAERYDKMLDAFPVVTPWQDPAGYSAFHLYVIRLGNGADRRRVFESMRQRGIGVQVHYIPVHLQPYYQRLGFKVGDFPEAEHYYSQAMTLPLYPALTDDQQAEVLRALIESLSTTAA